MEKTLRNRIELLRKVMVELAYKRGSLLDKDVIWLSQELDKAILMAQIHKRQSKQILKKAQ